MSIEAMNWAKRQQVGCPGRKAVLLMLADRADEAWSCFPSVALIAVEVELSPRSVQRHIHRLWNDRVLHVEERPGRRSRYTLAPGVTPDMVSPVTPDTDVTPDKVSPLTKTTVTPDKNDISPTPPIKLNPQKNPQGGVESPAREPSDLERICAAAGPGLASIDAEPQIILTATIIPHWKAAGADIDLDAIPVIAAMTAQPRDRPIKTLRYFDRAVRQHAAERLAKPIPIEPAKFGEFHGGQQPARAGRDRAAQVADAAKRLEAEGVYGSGKRHGGGA